VSKVPGRAERPVTLYGSELDSALALGTKPVATVGPVPRYLGRGAADIEVVKPSDLARIEAINPDVILAANPTHKRLYTRLKRIAPTVVLTEGINWKANFRQDGEALGHADRAESLLTRYDRRAARVRQIARSRELPGLPIAAEKSLRRPFVASILDDLGLDHPKPGQEVVAGAKPGRDDEWTLGEGYLAAMAVLADIERLYRG
jgi:iron complex transport system substrate-binding protein